MTQSAFARALLNPDLPAPPGLTGPKGGPAERRYAVYRNNVTQGLTEALEAGFPIVRKLLGDDFFAAMAREFLRANPPQSRILMLYGNGFAEFLEGFTPVRHLAYLPDVARLEQALRESYHSADAAPLSQADLDLLAGADPASLRLSLAPSLRLVPSHWPLHDIWLCQTEDSPPPGAEPQDVLVMRPEFDPMIHRLPPGGARLLQALMRAENLEDAARRAGPDLDLTAILTLLLRGRAITGVHA